jgi:hypothetical protein
MLRVSSFAFVTFALSLTAAACSSSAGPSLNPERTNCNIVCDKGHDCLAKDSDADKCSDDCTSKSDKDDVYKAKVKECSDCVEPKACSEAGSCLDNCLKIYLP